MNCRIFVSKVSYLPDNIPGSCFPCPLPLRGLGPLPGNEEGVYVHGTTMFDEEITPSCLY